MLVFCWLIYQNSTATIVFEFNIKAFLLIAKNTEMTMNIHI